MNTRVQTLSAPRITYCGSAALLFDAEGPLALPTQQRIWSLAKRVRDWPHVNDVQPGMNNLLIVIDPLQADAQAISDQVMAAWQVTEAGTALGKLLEVGVVYGGEEGMDLNDVAAHHRLSVDEIVRLHAAPEYVVFAPGVAPGYGYLFGLDPRLFIARRKVPVMRPIRGSVAIAGLQANLGSPRRPGGPTHTPTGWHQIGNVPDVPVPFDLSRSPPNLLDLGDRIRFRVERIER